MVWKLPSHGGNETEHDRRDMVIYIEEYLGRRLAGDHLAVARCAAIATRVRRAAALHGGHYPGPLPASAQPAASPDAISLPAATELSALYAEASLI